VFRQIAELDFAQQILGVGIDQFFLVLRTLMAKHRQLTDVEGASMLIPKIFELDQ
jgi:hypothetical protein